MPNVTITLSTPIEGPEGQITSIVMREPKFGDVMQLGEPAAFARSDEGIVYTAENNATVKSYIHRLLVEPKDPLLLEQLSLKDTIALKEAVFGFFRDARSESSV